VAQAQILPPRHIRPDWLVKDDDDLVKDISKAVFDVLWQRGQVDLRVRQNLHRNAVHGWSVMLFEFDDDAVKPILRHLPVKQVYMDPTVEDIADASYAGYDLWVDADEAKALYPKLAEKIELYAVKGQPTQQGGTTELAQTNNRDFRRRGVLMRVMWLRNQPIPLTTEEAIARKAIDQRDVEVIPDADEVFAGVDFGQEAGDGSVQEAEAADPDSTSSTAVPGDAAPAGDDAGEMGEGLSEGSPGGEAAPPMVPALPTRPALFLPDTDEEITPEHGEWPHRYCIRQITIIANAVAEDRECEFPDIPLLHNVNIPLPTGEPFGYGEPQRLYPLVKAESRFLRKLVAHVDYYGNPIQTISDGMATLMGEDLKDIGEPGALIKVPDDQWKQVGGKIAVNVDPPMLPPAVIDAFGLLKRELQDQGGNKEVLEGRTNSQIKSGKQYEAMAASAASQIGFKSQRAGDMVERLARFLLHAAYTRMTPEQFHKIYSKIPLACMKHIHARGRDVEWNLKVSVQPGSGSEFNKKQQALAERQAGLISDETYYEETSRDPRIEMQRKRNQMYDQAKDQQAIAPPPMVGAPAGPTGPQGGGIPA
jgi:hypothetical protein